jgi:hypothetical protein
MYREMDMRYFAASIIHFDGPAARDLRAPD